MLGTSFKFAFQAIAKYQNRPSSSTVLFSSTAEEDLTKPTQDLMERLARRIGLWCNLSNSRSLLKGDVPLPGILLAEDGSYIALLSETTEGNFICAGFDDSDDFEELSNAELKKIPSATFLSFSQVYINNDVFSKNGQTSEIEKRHWFFGSISNFCEQ